MPAISFTSSRPSLLPAHEFHQTRGIPSGTNSTLPAQNTQTGDNVWYIIIVILLNSLLGTFIGCGILLLCYKIRLWALNRSWACAKPGFVKTIIAKFSRSPKPEPVVERTEPEPEQLPPDPPPPEDYYEKIKKTCTSGEISLWDNVTSPDAITSGFETLHLSTATIETVKSFVTPLLNQRNEFTYGVLKTGITPGLLLYGPPGTGKTQLVKALAKYCDASVLCISGGRIHSRWFGESEGAVVSVFSLARKLSPCIIFIDEADDLFRRRASDGFESEMHRSVTSQFLMEWDGFDSAGDKPICVVLATNRPYDLDEAVLRRVPKRVPIGIPTFEDRLAILQIHLKEEQLDTDVNLEAIARNAEKFTGSDLKNLCIAAAYACIFEYHAMLTNAETNNEATKVESRHKDSEEESRSVETEAEIDLESVGDEDEENIPLLELPRIILPTNADRDQTDQQVIEVVTEPEAPRRILKARHFEKAMKDISPSSTSNTGLSSELVWETLSANDGRLQRPKPKATTKRTFVVPASRVPH